MDEQALERAKQRIAEARAGRNEEGRFEVALRRSREEVEARGAAALALEASMPDRIGEAVQDGMRREVLPVARALAEIKGLLNNAIGRLERLEQELIGERNARLDDLTLLVDLIQRHAPQARIDAFAFRAVSPLFDGNEMSVNATLPDADHGVKLWAANSDGRLAMSAEAHLE